MHICFLYKAKHTTDTGIQEG